MQKYLLLALVTIYLSSCTAGTNFVRPDAKTLALGKATFTELRQKLGKPFQEGTTAKNDNVFTTDYYIFAGGGQPIEAGVTPLRGLKLYFLKDILVGSTFTSTFTEDHTKFDESKRSQIVVGKTTRQEVITLLGQPGGFFASPLATNDALVYYYQSVQNVGTGFKTTTKTLTISTDNQNIVSNVLFDSEINAPAK
jgi:hypothetical protein